MLQAQNGRQLNLAAETIRAFFGKRNISLKQSDALQLVSQLIGFPTYNAARAGLKNAEKGVTSDVTTWRDLAHAIGTMKEEHLDMRVEVADSRLFRACSTFGLGAKVQLATPERLGAEHLAFKVDYPALLVVEGEDDLSPGRPTEADLAPEKGNRIRHQFEVATDLSAAIVNEAILDYGLRDAVTVLNSQYGLHISLGPFVAYSESNEGFWNIDFGFVLDKASATGFDNPDDLPKLVGTPDLEMVPYEVAVDVDESAENKFADQVRGGRVSRYQWPERFVSLWSEISPRISELLDATKKLVEAKSVNTQIVAREHVGGTGEQLVLELYSGAPDDGDAVFGGRLVFALADFQRSGFLNAAGLGVFLEIPGRELSLAYSLNIERQGEAPFATEAKYFFEDLLHQTPKKLADELMLHANFEHGSSTN